MNYRKMAQKQDQRVAEKTGLNIEINSGALRGRKGDLYDKYLLMETKSLYYEKPTFSLKKKWIDKIKEEAFQMGKSFWAFCFSFGNLIDYVIISGNTFLALRQGYKGQAWTENLFIQDIDLPKKPNFNIDRGLIDSVKTSAGGQEWAIYYHINGLEDLVLIPLDDFDLYYNNYLAQEESDENKR